jgi:hypothetical protein
VGLLASQYSVLSRGLADSDLSFMISESVVDTLTYSDVFPWHETSASVSYTSIERSPVIILVYIHATGLTVKKGATELFWLCRLRVSLPIIPPVGSNISATRL